MGGTDFCQVIVLLVTSRGFTFLDLASEHKLYNKFMLCFLGELFLGTMTDSWNFSTGLAL